MKDPTRPIRIDPEAIFDDGVLILTLGLTHAALAKARRNGRLQYTRNGRRILYRGQWVIDWLESEAQVTKGKGGAAMTDSRASDAKRSQAVASGETSQGDEPVSRLSVGAAEAARLLDIGERLLWSKSVSGEIPSIKIGARRLYPLHMLREYLTLAAKRGRR